MSSRRGNAFLGLLILVVALIAVSLIAAHWNINVGGDSNSQAGGDLSQSNDAGNPDTTSQDTSYAPALSNADIIQAVEPSVVLIQTSSTVGTGFIIKSSGIILTNAHVIPSDANFVMVRLKDYSVYAAKVIGRDDKIDLAAVQINKTH